MNSDEQMRQFQEQILASIKAQQEAYLNSIKAWNQGVKSTSGTVPPAFAVPVNTPGTPVPPSLPAFDPLPGSTEFADANRAFMQKMFAQQQEFLGQLNNAFGVTGHQ